MKTKTNLTEQLTTKEHFNKYKDFLKGVNTADKLRLVKGLYSCEEELQKLYNKDVHLNNIPMKLIDDKFKEVMQVIKPNKREENGKIYLSMSLAESCCILKHILIYTILEIKPVFEEDIKNYKELYADWRNQSDEKKYGLKGVDFDKWILLNKSKWVLQ